MAAGSVRHEMMGRSLKDLISWSGYLEEKGVGLVSLQESIDTGSSTGKLVFHMFGALAEFERNLIRERTMAGLQAARARGKMGGRSKTLSPDQQKRLKQLYKDQNVSVKEICQMMSISKPTLYKYLKNGHKTG
jgi:DNA invertase Pin-like site-specific DNA recombinase